MDWGGRCSGNELGRRDRPEDGGSCWTVVPFELLWVWLFTDGSAAGLYSQERASTTNVHSTQVGLPLPGYISLSYSYHPCAPVTLSSLTLSKGAFSP